MIVVVGFMGAGKTTVGRILAERLGLPFLDSDRVIEHQEHRSIPTIFAESGEAGFRVIEEQMIRGLLDGPPSVLSLGGGACGSATTRQRLGGHTVVYLHVELDEVIQRVGGDPDRPLLHRPDLPARYAGRLQHYADVATITVTTTGRDPQDLVAEILDRVGDPARGDPARRDPARGDLERADLARADLARTADPVATASANGGRPEAGGSDVH